MQRKAELLEITSKLDTEQQRLIDPLLDDIVFLEKRMNELRELPFVSVHPKNKAIQKTTAAAIQYKRCSESHMNKIRFVSGLLRKIDNSAADELMKRLEEFA